MDKKWNLQDIKSPSRTNKVETKVESKNELPVRRDSTAPVAEKMPAAEKVSASNTYKEEYEDTYRAEAEQETPVTKSTPRPPRKKRPLLKYGLITAAIVLLLVFVAGQFTAKTELMVQPRTNEPNLNSEFTAYIAPENDQLGYEVLTVEAEGERQVAASGETEEVAVKASGNITIYKTTAGEQRLIATTRFEDGDGRIYRITDGVTIPGGTADAPGTVTVGIEADEAGEAYNAPANTRFTVPGLESDNALFSAIYGTNTAAFTGGFEGVRVIVDDADLQSAQSAIRAELEETLRGRVGSERPADFVSFAGSEKFVYETLPSSEAAAGTALVKEKVSLEIPIFKNSALASFLAKSLVNSYEGGPVRVQDYGAISFAYTASSSEQATLSESDTIDFTLTGRPLLVWEYDQKTLETDLLGASEATLPNILGAYPAIEQAEATFAPFWKKSFPDSAAKITITEVLTWPE